MKAYGMPLTIDQDNCFGVCISENHKLLGRHTSSSYEWLAKDLKTKAEGYEYEFIPEIPSNLSGVVNSIFYEIDDKEEKISTLEAEIKQFKQIAAELKEHVIRCYGSLYVIKSQHEIDEMIVHFIDFAEGRVK